MISYAGRRLLFGSLLAGFCAALVLADALGRLAFARTATWTGWSLYAICIFLALYNLRKKALVVLGLGSSALWLQTHVYFGLFSIVLFLVHVGWRWPNGILEATLALVFTLVAGSGVLGLFLSRSFPSRLARRGQEVLFERIPRLRRQLADQASELVLASVETGGARTLPDFYAKQLARYFAGPRSFWLHLLGSNWPRRRLLADLQALERFLNKEELEALRRLDELVGLKDDLDFHYALQATLKRWLFVHIPLTYGLLAVGLVHGCWAQWYVR